MEKKNDSRSNNKLIKRKRVMRYFIDAAAEIASTEGMNSLTIRSVADKAGYNSATLYNYFEDLNELMAFASISLIEDWLYNAVATNSGPGDALDHYILNWKSYVEYSLRTPVGFTYIFSSKDTDSIIKYFEKYYTIFPHPDEEAAPGSIHAFWKPKSLEDQEREMIAPVIKAGFIAESDAESIYRLCQLLHNGILWEHLQMDSKTSIEKDVNTFLNYLVPYIQTKLRKKKDLSVYLSASASINN